MGTVAAILGSTWMLPAELECVPVLVDTPFGLHTLHRVDLPGRVAWVSYRYGAPRARLPHQVNYRAQAAAFAEVGCKALLITCSVRALDPDLPLFTPLVVRDLLMLDNRLPDGSPCTMFPQRSHDQGHLVYDEGPFSVAVDQQVRALANRSDVEIGGSAVLSWHVGPRARTRAEQRMLGRLGAQVEAMTLAPEVVLSNELGIPCSGVVAAQARSDPDDPSPPKDPPAPELERARAAMQALIVGFLRDAEPARAGNRVHRFDRRRF